MVSARASLIISWLHVPVIHVTVSRIKSRRSRVVVENHLDLPSAPSVEQ
jgi:hypothetical protein